MNETLVNKMSVSDVQAKCENDGAQYQLVDVRSPLEFESEHISESINIPLGEMANRAFELKKEANIVLVCRTGNRALRANDLLARHSYKTIVMDGGIEKWKQENLPVIEGKKVISLERQTQLTIGIILLLSVAAGFIFNQWFFLVPAFIGAGLTFAGLSGTCGLALLIAQAPWNKLDSKSTSGCCSQK